jgi:hypothetical protein
VLASGHLQQLELSLLQQRVAAQKSRALGSRTPLQTGGALTVAEARILQATKTATEAQKQLIKEARAANRAASQAQNQLHWAGIEARKQERARKKRVLAYQKANKPVPLGDQDPIPDPEAQAQAQESRSESGSGSRSQSRSRSRSLGSDRSDRIIVVQKARRE